MPTKSGGFSGGANADSLGDLGGRDRDNRSRSRGRGGPADGRPTKAGRLPQSAPKDPLLNKDAVAPAPVDPEPQTPEQIAARQAEVRRSGRGSTILSGKLGVAAGPNISRAKLGG